MRLRQQVSAGENGAVLLIALAFALILGLTLTGYLSWVRTQNLLVAESQAWNAALAHAEGGIEEGMAQLNVSFGTNYPSSAQTNWGGLAASGFYGPRSYAFTNGSYSAIIIPGSPGPTIISTGYAIVPIIGRQIARTIEVRTRPEPAFAYGISVINNLSGNGNNVIIDSYDSTDPRHSTPGGLWDLATRKAGGDVVSTDGIINVGSADIYGHIRTAPWGSATVQSMNGRVGDLTWTSGGIEPGWYANDLNLDFFDLDEPFTGGYTSLPAGTGTNTYELTAGDYVLPGNLDLGNGETLYVSGTVNLWVKGNVRGQGGTPGSFITLAPGASLQFYVGTVKGPPVSTTLFNVNTSGTALNFGYWGLPSNTTISWNGNASFVGTLYAPEADLVFNGGGGTDFDFMGACVARSATLTGHFKFHYDENLKKNGPQMGYVACSWREL